jgi:hypothetical protein
MPDNNLENVVAVTRKKTVPAIIEALKCESRIMSGPWGKWTAELAKNLEEAWELAKIDFDDEHAMFLLKEYARTRDEDLTPKALELKRELQAIGRESLPV